MEREPYQPGKQPRCYALSFEPKDPTCRECRVARKCERVKLRWSDRLSIREHMVQAEKDLQDSLRVTGTEETEDAVDIYIRLYRKYLDKSRDEFRFQKLRSGKGAKTLNRIHKMCKDEGLDFEMWVAANMIRRGDWAKKTKWGFQPNLLSGDKARANYNAHIRKASRRLKVNTEQEAGDSIGLMREVSTWADDEMSVAEDYVATYLLKGEADWKESASSIEVSAQWKVQRVSKFIGRVVKLRAAVYVLSQYDVRYPDVIGLKVFSWEAVAQVLVRLVPKLKTQKTITTGDVSTFCWRGNRRGKTEHE